MPIDHRDGCACGSAIDRRRLLAAGAVLSVLPSLARAGAALPAEVAGVTIPQSAIALAAAGFARKSCPDFLFNHGMRTFLFGALLLQKRKMAYQADQAFVAAALHDLGLLPSFESKQGSFEIDGADAAEKFMRDANMPAADADIVWHAVEMHDGKWALTRRHGPEAMLVAFGAGSDVGGPDPSFADAGEIAEIVAAFPRLQFKTRFTALLIDHCKRKPTSQSGTWLEGLCREQVPDAWTDSVEKAIAAAPFAE